MDMGGGEMSSNKIPTEEDFERAKAADAERNRGLSEVAVQILHRFGGNGVHDAYVFYSQRNDTFHPLVFFRWERQIEEAEKSGLASQIRQAVVEELERVGRGNRDTIKVDFEFDSHENVEAKFAGNYFFRRNCSPGVCISLKNP